MKVAKIAALFALLTLLGLGLAWQRVGIIARGYEIRRLGVAKADLERRQRDLLCEIGALSAPDAMAQRLQVFNVRLARPESLRQFGASGIARLAHHQECPPTVRQPTRRVVVRQGKHVVLVARHAR